MEAIWYVIGVGGVVAILVWAFATLKGNGQASKAAQAEILKLTSEKIKIESEYSQLKDNFQEIEKELQTLRVLKNDNAVLHAKFEDQKFNLNELKNKYETIESKYEHLLSDKEAKSSEVIKLSTQLETERQQVTQLLSDKKTLASKLEEKEEILSKLKAECIKLSTTNEMITTQLNENAKSIDQMKASLTSKEKEVGKLQEQISEYERRQKEDQKHEQELIKQRVQEWKNHESHVKEELKKIAMRCEVEIPKSAPFHGANDNYVLINGEYVIFDASAPKNIEDLEKYLYEQIKRISKYTNESMVKKEAFLIVPDSALEQINAMFKDMEGNNLSIIPLCSVEHLIRSMKMIENVQQVEILSPEQRDKLVQFISKSTSVIKQKIQLDQAYSSRFFEILDEAKKLPNEFLTSNQNEDNQQIDEEEIPPFFVDGPEKKAS